MRRSSGISSTDCPRAAIVGENQPEIVMFGALSKADVLAAAAASEQA